MKLTFTFKRLALLVTLALVAVSLQAQTATVKHVVDRGETLESIAKTYNTTVDEIVKLNPNAAQFIYVGMELTVPKIEKNTIKPDVITNSTDNPNNSTYYYESFTRPEQKEENNKYFYQNSNGSFESNRVYKMLEAGFCCMDVDDFKQSSGYGLSFTILPWKIADRLYVGAQCSPFYCNYGLAKDKSGKNLFGGKITLGPALGYYFTPTILMTSSLNAICTYTFGDIETTNEFGDTETKKDQFLTSWSASLVPSVYLGNQKGGLFLGPELNFSFYKSKVNVAFGFHVGFYLVNI